MPKAKVIVRPGARSRKRRGKGSYSAKKVHSRRKAY